MALGHIFVNAPAFEECLTVVAMPGFPSLFPSSKMPVVPSPGSSPAACAHSLPLVSSAPLVTRGVLSTPHPANTHG